MIGFPVWGLNTLPELRSPLNSIEPQCWYFLKIEKRRYVSSEEEWMRWGRGEVGREWPRGEEEGETVVRM